jgi:hypothetical protein
MRCQFTVAALIVSTPTGAGRGVGIAIAMPLNMVKIVAREVIFIVTMGLM